MKILLVEDDQFLGEMLSSSLTSNHYTVDLAADGEVGLELAYLWKYDLVILDLQLPKLDGLSVCRQLRSKGLIVPILILTSQNSNQEIATGLDAGADDYLVKPFNLDELLARIRALLRRGNTETIAPVLAWGNLCLDPSIAQVTYLDRIVAVRPKEYVLLELLLRCPHQIFSRDAIIDRLWTADDCPTKHAVTNLIKDLRHRLNDAGMTEELIETVYGIGYRVKTPPQNKSEAIENKQEVISKGIAEIQARFINSLEHRIEILQEAVRSIEAGELDDAQRLEAREEAHRLAGSFGTFGYPQSSVLARSIEHLLLGADRLTDREAAKMHQLLLELKQSIDKSPDSIVSSNALPEPIVLFISGDLKLADTFYQEAIAHKFRFESIEAANVQRRLEQGLAKEKISAILLTLDRKSRDLSLLQSLKQQFPTIPVLILADRNPRNDSAQEILHERIQVARLGVDRYLLQPITPDRVFTVIDRVISQSIQALEPVKAKIMVVDDDPIILTFLANLLPPWGLQVTCLDNPIQFWEVLTATQPDLLLLDLEMPTFKGIELCQVIRNDPQWMNLPILMITANDRAEAIAQAFAAGCDDFVRKPIIEPELIARVLKHLEPARIRL